MKTAGKEGPSSFLTNTLRMSGSASSDCCGPCARVSFVIEVETNKPVSRRRLRPGCLSSSLGRSMPCCHPLLPLDMVRLPPLLDGASASVSLHHLHHLPLCKPLLPPRQSSSKSTSMRFPLLSPPVSPPGLLTSRTSSRLPSLDGTPTLRRARRCSRPLPLPPPPPHHRHGRGWPPSGTPRPSCSTV